MDIYRVIVVVGIILSIALWIGIVILTLKSRSIRRLWESSKQVKYEPIQFKESKPKTKQVDEITIEGGEPPTRIVDLGDGTGLGPDGDIYEIVSKKKKG